MDRTCVVYVLLFLCSVGLSDQQDPCFNHKQMYSVEIRGSGCHSVTNGTPLCDRLLQKGWYRAKYRGIDLEIPTVPPAFGYCGTATPLWMNGSHPSITDDIVHRNVCATGLKPCIKTYNIRVKKCLGFYVYELTYTNGCPEAFCFGNDVCHQPVTNPLTTLSSESTTSSFPPTAHDNIETKGRLVTKQCQHKVDIAATVAGCLCSTLVGSLLTILVLNRLDGKRRTNVLLVKSVGKHADPLCYSVSSFNGSTGLTKTEPSDDAKQCNTHYNLQSTDNIRH